MDTTLGRREASKVATRQALTEAADRLFAERGFAATTVRDIAGAAGVTERTFFRYFGSKEELILDDALGWVPVLIERVRARPAREDVITALRRAVLDISSMLAEDERPYPVWLFTEGPPGPRISRPRKGLALRLEADLAEAIRARLDRAGNGSGIETGYLADILARTTFALLRSIMIRGWELRTAEGGGRKAPSASTLINQAFATMTIPVAAKGTRTAAS